MQKAPYPETVPAALTESWVTTAGTSLSSFKMYFVPGKNVMFQTSKIQPNVQ